jgi:molecular chaperone GrpE
VTDAHRRPDESTTGPATDAAADHRRDPASTDRSDATAGDADAAGGPTAQDAAADGPAAGDPAAAPTHARPADAAAPGDPTGAAAAGAATTSASETTTSASGGGMDLAELADTDPRDRAELLGELLTAEEKRDEYLDDLRRSHADFENYRRRVMRESAAQREHGKADVTEALLEVLDDLDRTLQAAEGSSDPSLAKGVELVAGKLVGALQGIGLQRLDGDGVPFDPNQHEAVQQQPAEEPRDEPVVAQVLRPGYKLGDRVLRAAMVVVEQ